MKGRSSPACKETQTKTAGRCRPLASEGHVFMFPARGQQMSGTAPASVGRRQRNSNSGASGGGAKQWCCHGETARPFPRKVAAESPQGPAMAPRRHRGAGCVKKGKRGLELALVHSSREVEAAHKFVG